MTKIYIDIETIPAPLSAREFMRPDPMQVKLGNIKDQSKAEEKIAKAITEWESGIHAALDPLQANIAMIGYAMEDCPVTSICYEQSEAGMLQDFWALIISASSAPGDIEIIGHNIRFDASMLVQRSWILGVQPYKYLVADLYGRSPRHWLDTMDVWRVGDYKADYRKLKDLCGAFGIVVKESEVTGADFWKWWAKDKPKCVDYNAQDVEAVRQLWNRIGN